MKTRAAPDPARRPHLWEPFRASIHGKARSCRARADWYRSEPPPSAGEATGGTTALGEAPFGKAGLPCLGGIGPVEAIASTPRGILYRQPSRRSGRRWCCPWRRSCWGRPRGCGSPRREAELLLERAGDGAADGVVLPAGGRGDLLDGRALGALEQLDQLRLLGAGPGRGLVGRRGLRRLGRLRLGRLRLALRLAGLACWRPVQARSGAAAPHPPRLPPAPSGAPCGLMAASARRPGRAARPGSRPGSCGRRAGRGRRRGHRRW